MQLRGRAQVQQPERGAALARRQPQEQERERQEEQQSASRSPLACGERGEKRQSFLRSPGSRLPGGCGGPGAAPAGPGAAGSGRVPGVQLACGRKTKGKGRTRAARREGGREAEGANRSVTWRLFSLSARALLGAVVPEEEEAGGGGHSARGRAVSLAPGQDHSIAS